MSECECVSGLCVCACACACVSCVSVRASSSLMGSTSIRRIRTPHSVAAGSVCE